METELINSVTTTPELDDPAVGIDYRPGAATAADQSTNAAGSEAKPAGDGTAKLPEVTSTPVQQEPSAVEAAQRQWQQERQALAYELQRRDAESQQMRDLLWQIRLANTPEDQRQGLIAERLGAERMAERQALQEERTQFYRGVEPIMKEVVLNDLLNQFRQYGVTKEELASFEHPQDAVRFGEAMARRHRAVQAQKAAPAAQAATTQGAPAPKNWRSMSLAEQLGAAIASIQ